MSVIDKERGFIFIGSSFQATCNDTALVGTGSGDVTSVYVNNASGAVPNHGNPSKALIEEGVLGFECGTMYILYSGNVGYSISDAILGSLDADKGRMIPAYVETFSTVGGASGWNVEGMFYMTSLFMNLRPTYKNLTNGWWCWFDGSSWVMSHAGRDKTDKFMLNNASLPNYGTYEGTGGSASVYDTSCFSLHDFTGLRGEGAPDGQGANGLYCESGMLFGKKTFVHEKGTWHVYWNGEKWTLTDTPYNDNGYWINNGAGDVVGDFVYIDDNMSNGFNGQTGHVSPAGVLSGSLLTEDEANPAMLLVEDNLQSIVTEAAD